MKDSLNRVISHGLSLEIYLVVVKIWYGIALIVTANSTRAEGTLLYDIWTFLPDTTLGLLFLGVSAIQAIGIMLNLCGFESSWIWRVVGTHIAMVMWSWMIVKHYALDLPFSGTIPFWGMSFFASWLILWKAYSRLPIPGKI